MKKKLHLTCIPFVLVILFDQLSKWYFRNQENNFSFSIFNFRLVFNNGFLLGSLNEMPQNVKEVFLTTLGSIIFSGYIFVLWLLPIRSSKIYLGLSFIVSGIIGNVIDRFNGFSVVDFISINLLQHHSPYANFADIFQWMGYFLLMIGIRNDYLYYWPQNDWRKKFVIQRRFQFKYALVVSSIVFFSTLIFMVFSYSFLKNNQTSTLILYYLLTGLSLSIFISALVFIVAIMVTHRIAGPIFAIKRHLKELKIGNKKNFKLRENDEFKEFEILLAEMTDED